MTDDDSILKTKIYIQFMTQLQYKVFKSQPNSKISNPQFIKVVYSKILNFDWQR